MKSLNIDELTIEQKIGQLFVVRTSVLYEEDKEFIFEMLEKGCVGGIQVPVLPGCEERIKEIKAHADYPVLICADMEQGFQLSDYQIPSNIALAMTANEELAYQFGAVTAIEAKKRGYNTVWSPVVDILDGNAMCRVPRVFGSDVDLISKMGTAMLRGFYDNGMLASMKHWPCPTDGTTDGHVFAKKGTALTEKDLREKVMKPYKYAMDNLGLKAVMSGHSFWPNIDPDYVGTLSEKLIGILRNEGYDGLIFTDSFAMMGVLQRYGEENCCALAIRAGNDMVLPNYRTNFKKSYEELLTAYKNGVFSEERLNEAVRRVIEAQNFTLTPATATEVSDYQKECFKQIRKDSVCVVKDDNVDLKLSENTKKLFVVMTENIYKDDNGVTLEIGDHSGINDTNIDAVKESILKRFPGSDIKIISQFPSPPQIEAVCSAAVNAKDVIYITCVSSTSYRIGENLTEPVENLMLSMDYRLAAVVHLGNPYCLERVTHFPRYVMSVGGKENSIDLALSALAGEYEPKGKLPFKITLK